MAPLADASAASLHAFVTDHVAPGASVVTLPEWVMTLTREPDYAPQPVHDAMRDNARITYGQAAIDGEANRVANAEPGRRNDTLNTAAWRLGRLAGGGELDLQDAARALWDAARACGLVDDDGAMQVRRTIESGLRAGMNQPRARRERVRHPDPDETRLAEGRTTGEHCPGQRDLGTGRISRGR
jgi:hypothetical protein